MRPRKREAEGSDDLFRARPDQIINMRHELIRLADRINWAWIDDQVSWPANMGSSCASPISGWPSERRSWSDATPTPSSGSAPPPGAEVPAHPPGPSDPRHPTQGQG